MARTLPSVTRRRGLSRDAGQLTTRQIDVVRLVALGMTDRQIAAEVVVSTKTFGRHLENIYAMLGVSSRTSASLEAVRRGLASPGPPAGAMPARASVD